MKALVAYFSRAGENYVSGSLKMLKKGNTEIAAEMISNEIEGDLFLIDPVIKYSENYNQCIEEAKEDQRRDARPELSAYPESIDAYDTIYLGYPNYWGTMPMAVFTFLEKFDFSGKTIKPFCTHEGNGMGRSEADIRKLCPKTKIEKGLAIHGTNIKSAENTIKKWAKA